MFKKFLILIASVVLINQDCAAKLTQVNDVEFDKDAWQQAIKDGDMDRINELFGDKPRVMDMNYAFRNAALYGQKEVMESLLAGPHRKLLTQIAVDSAFSDAAKGGHLDIMKWLLTKPHGIPHPVSLGVSLAFTNAIGDPDNKHPHLEIVKWLLTKPHDIPLLKETPVFKVFVCAAKHNDEHLMETLLKQPHGIPLPDKDAVDHAFSAAAKNGNHDIVKYLLRPRKSMLGGKADDLPGKLPVVTKPTILYAYKDIKHMKEHKFTETIALLTPHIQKKDL